MTLIVRQRIWGHFPVNRKRTILINRNGMQNGLEGPILEFGQPGLRSHF